MLVMLNGVEQNYKVTSHVLESDPENPNMFLLFHCWKCGLPCFQFSGDVIMSNPGGQVFSKLPVIHMCRKCKQRHLINSIL